MAIREVKFESQDRRMPQILAALNANGIKSIEEANEICEQYGLDPYKTCEETQPICFENAKWAYVVGAAIALKKGCSNAADAAEAIGVGLQSFCVPGSVADDRKVGLGHGNLAARLLREETKCFAFLAGHESFAAAEGAIKIAAKADKVRKEPLRCILNGLGKDAAMIISRINGFTYCQTEFDYATGEVKVVNKIAYSDGPRAKVNCYGADDVREGVAIMHLEGVDVSITGNSTNPTRFQHPVAGTYKKECMEMGKKYFSVASGGGKYIGSIFGSKFLFCQGFVEQLGRSIERNDTSHISSCCTLVYHDGFACYFSELVIRIYFHCLKGLLKKRLQRCAAFMELDLVIFKLDLLLFHQPW